MEKWEWFQIYRDKLAFQLERKAKFFSLSFSVFLSPYHEPSLISEMIPGGSRVTHFISPSISNLDSVVL